MPGLAVCGRGERVRGLLAVMLSVVLLASCSYREVEREIGYKGKARVNPWLAVERFCERWGWEPKPVIAWTAPEWRDAVWIVPASILSNESFTRRMRDWIVDGGHLILLIEHTDAATNDWSVGHVTPVLEPALHDFLEGAGLVLDEDDAVDAGTVVFGGMEFEVEADSDASVKTAGGTAGVFASSGYGDGRISVVTDGRIFRNRWIGDEQHAEFFSALLGATDHGGVVGIMRGSGVSFFGLLRKHLWPVLIALGVLVLLWLWKSIPRFGPIEAVGGGAELRGYERHLEALGDFNWRLDKGAALLAPLRDRVVELGQHASERAGKRDEDLFQFLADRAGLTRERVFRAMAEAAPTDATVLTRSTADLQQLLKALHTPSSS